MSALASWWNRIRGRESAPTPIDPVVSDTNSPKASDPVASDIRVALDTTWTEPTPGMRLGRYMLVQRVGEGGYAQVWSAKYTGGATPLVAVKVFVPHGFPSADKAAAAARFWDGVSAMRQLDGVAGIVRVLDSPSIDGPHIWFAMQFCPELDVARAIRRGNVTEDHLVGLVDDLLNSLDRAHAHGVVHRDVRPPNLLLSRESDNKLRGLLADFDLAYFPNLERAGESTAAPPGLTRYWPSDLVEAAQERKKALARRQLNDVYAAGVTIFEFFAGLDADLPERNFKLFFRALPKRTRLTPKGFSRGTRIRVARLCSRALAPATRFATAADMIAFWDSYAREPRWTTSVVVSSIVFFASGASLVVDFALGQLAPLMATASLLVGIGAIHRWTTAGADASPRRLRGWLAKQPHGVAVSCALLLIALATVTGALHFTDFFGRLRTWRVSGAAGCQVVHSGPDSRVVVNRDDPLDVVRVGRSVLLECPKGTSPSRHGKSMLTPELGVRVQESPPVPPPASSTPSPPDPVPAPRCRTGMVYVPAGTFARAEDRRTVGVDPFCIGATEVTVGAYTECVDAGRCRLPGDACRARSSWATPTKKTDVPATCVTWRDAVRYCDFAAGRLPTDEEWEWAARSAKPDYRWPWGTQEPGPDHACWSGGSTRLGGPCTVRAYPMGKSEQGVYDLVGNVFEWTSTARGAKRLARGGSWLERLSKTNLSMASVAPLDPEAEQAILGVRCASAPAR